MQVISRKFKQSEGRASFKRIQLLLLSDKLGVMEKTMDVIILRFSITYPET